MRGVMIKLTLLLVCCSSFVVSLDAFAIDPPEPSYPDPRVPDQRVPDPTFPEPNCGSGPECIPSPECDCPSRPEIPQLGS